MKLFNFSTDARQLRVELNSSLPVDPLHLVTMAQYDLSLMLYRSWFAYDNGRRTDHGLIKSWKFDSSVGCYIFEIEKHAWSDGTPLTADHFIANLNRLIKSDTAYGKSIKEIVDLSTAKSHGDDSFSFCTKNKEPSVTLLNQLGSVFLSLVHPTDLDAKGEIHRNSLAIGPYMVSHQTADEIIFKENSGFPKMNSKAPKEIIVRAPSKNFSIDKFLEKKTWANYYQTSTMTTLETANRVIASKFPMWSRGFDRVALLRPLGTESQIIQRRKLLVYMGAKLKSSKILNHPLQVAIANSLQPIGYPLFKELDYSSEIKYSGTKEIKILSSETPALGLYQEMLISVFLSQGFKLEWIIVPTAKFLAIDWDKSGADLVLFSFGVADPEPSTWLGLIFDKKLIAYDQAELAEFESLLKLADHKKQNKGYVKMLNTIGIKGGYLPLLHGATVSIGQPGMNFDLVPKLDETVDYSKIQFEK